VVSTKRWLGDATIRPLRNNCETTRPRGTGVCKCPSQSVGSTCSPDQQIERARCTLKFLRRFFAVNCFNVARHDQRFSTFRGTWRSVLTSGIAKGGCVGRRTTCVVGAAALFGCGIAGAQTKVVSWSDPDTQTLASTYDSLYAVDWQDGLNAQIGVQAMPSALTVVADPIVLGRNALRASMSRGQDFSGVANGTPRAELLFPAPVAFEQGKDYLIRWSTFLPSDFIFDSQQLLIITQIHQSLTVGSPTIALGLLGTQYGISQRGGSNPTVSSGGKWLCCADADRGKWVHWTLRYVPDDTGSHSSLELYKNGTSVYAAQGAPNAYLQDQSSYLKIGLYKAAWKTQPSDVSQITMFFGPVSVSQR
jgi:hypothetical protein